MGNKRIGCNANQCMLRKNSIPYNQRECKCLSKLAEPDKTAVEIRLGFFEHFRRAALQLNESLKDGRIDQEDYLEFLKCLDFAEKVKR